MPGKKRIQDFNLNVINAIAEYTGQNCSWIDAKFNYECAVMQFLLAPYVGQQKMIQCISFSRGLLFLVVKILSQRQLVNLRKLLTIGHFFLLEWNKIS